MARGPARRTETVFSTMKIRPIADQNGEKPGQPYKVVYVATKVR
ncbi:hypothetical protein SALBM311S_08150 [Streptomyces alboniger]